MESNAVETHDTNSPEETYAFGRNFAQRLAVGDCVAMIGGLGAGKTALVRGIAEGLGLQDEAGHAIGLEADRPLTCWCRSTSASLRSSTWICTA